MRAMIFAAGLGTRLRPLTEHMPKALVSIAGEPMLKRVIMQLKESGFDEIVINVHYYHDMIIDYLKKNNYFGVKIHISDERNELLNTGGGLLQARKFLNKFDKNIFCNNINTYSDLINDESEDDNIFINDLNDISISGMHSFLVHNVDILSNCDLTKLYRTHIATNSWAEATMLVSRRNSTRQLLFDENNLLCGWINKITGETKPKYIEYKEGKYSEYAFSGIQVINPSLFDLMLEYNYKDNFSIIDFYMDMLENKELCVYGYIDNNLQVLDIGKPETIIEAENFIKTL